MIKITIATLIAALCGTAFAGELPSVCQELHKYETMVKEGRDFKETERFWFVEEFVKTPQRAVEITTPLCKQALLPSPRIGMAASIVVEKTNWGKPDDINRTTTRNGMREQWVYGNGNYLYFTNGRLTAIQN